MRHPKLRRDRVYLAAAALLPFALDILLTLLGQPASYWSGQHHAFDETNPVAASLLTIHPALFVAGALLYAILFTVGIYFLPTPIAWWLTIGLLLAHTGGARSWFWHFTDNYSFWDGVLNTTMSVPAAFCFLKASRYRYVKGKSVSASEGTTT